jgi:hypothetical protein
VAASGGISRNLHCVFSPMFKNAGCGLVIAYQRHHARRLRYFRQRLQNSVFGDLNVLERVNEQIAQQF